MAACRGDYDDRFATDYDARATIATNPRYAASDGSDPVIRSIAASDGRYYWQANDGTTGPHPPRRRRHSWNVIDGGRHRVGGTLIGRRASARCSASRSIRTNSDVRCR